jgi:hypothetical protein
MGYGLPPRRSGPVRSHGLRPLGFAVTSQVDAGDDGRTPDALGPWSNIHIVAELANPASQDDRRWRRTSSS